MPIVPVYLNVDEKTYAEVNAGMVELCGMAKNIGNKQIAKHIPVVADAVKDGAINAIDFFRGHKRKKPLLLVGSLY